MGKKALSVAFYTLDTPYYEGTSTEHRTSVSVTSTVSFRKLGACRTLSQNFQGLSI